MNDTEMPRSHGLLQNSPFEHGFEPNFEPSPASRSLNLDDSSTQTIAVAAQIVETEQEFDTDSEFEDSDAEGVEFDRSAFADEPIDDRAELLEQNQALLSFIAELERSLAECQVDFQEHLQQFQMQEDLLAQREQDLQIATERMSRLQRDLDESNKQIHRQEVLVETLKSQLDNSQERVAHMERDCTLAQKRFAEQAQQLFQAEALCRDLKSRLHRQQRYTLQFKAALEKCLDVNMSPQSFDLPDIPIDAIDLPEDFFPRSKPVQPWSGQLEGGEILLASSSSVGNLMAQAELAQAELTQAELTQAEPIQPGEERVPVAPLQTVAQLPLAQFAPPTPSADAPSQPEAGDLEADDADTYSPAAVGLTAPSSELEQSVFDPNLAEAIEVQLKQDLETLTQPRVLEDAELLTADILNDLEEPWNDTAANAVKNSKGISPFKPEPGAHLEIQPFDLWDAPTVAAVPETTFASASRSAAKDQPEELESQTPSSPIALQPNWPSPVVHPLRNARKRIKSLAAIDLPSFPKAEKV